MMHKLSIKWRLALQFSCFVGLILVLFGGAVFVLVTQKEKTDIDASIKLQYETIKGSIQDFVLSNEATDSENEILQKIDDIRNSGFFTFVSDPNDNVLSHSSVRQLPALVMQGYSDLELHHFHYRVYSGKENGFTVVIGKNTHDLEENQTTLLLILISVFFILFLISLIFSAVFAGRAIMPLSHLNTRVRAIEPPNLPDASLASSYPNDEIGKLAASFDGFLRKLKDAFQRERQFTQDASHELRTPLMVIKSSLELLLLHPKTLTDVQLQKLAIMQDGLRRMEGLVEELLFLSRGSVKIEKTDIHMKEFLQNLAPSYLAMAQEKGLTLTVKTEQDFVVHTSVAALEKVIGNLLKNAIRFTDKGGISVIIEDPHISVNDTGIGISKEQIPHIFERFYRADASRTGREGFGLGLAICKEIFDREGWKIDVESDVGQGSAFAVTFAESFPKVLTKN